MTAPGTTLLALDTSVAVAAFSTWHEHHEEAAQLVARERPRLVAHAAVETFSVLTRLPGGRHLRGTDAAALIVANFSEGLLTLSPVHHVDLLRRMADAAVTGGTAYDALVGTTAAAAGATLVTLDRRALPTYRAVGATARLLAG